MKKSGVSDSQSTSSRTHQLQQYGIKHSAAAVLLLTHSPAAPCAPPAPPSRRAPPSCPPRPPASHTTSTHSPQPPTCSTMRATCASVRHPQVPLTSLPPHPQPTRPAAPCAPPAPPSLHEPPSGPPRPPASHTTHNHNLNPPTCSTMRATCAPVTPCAARRSPSPAARRRAKRRATVVRGPYSSSSQEGSGCSSVARSRTDRSRQRARAWACGLCAAGASVPGDLRETVMVGCGGRSSCPAPAPSQMAADAGSPHTDCSGQTTTVGNWRPATPSSPTVSVPIPERQPPSTPTHFHFTHLLHAPHTPVVEGAVGQALAVAGGLGERRGEHYTCLVWQ